MFGGFTVGLLAALGVAAWTYTRTLRRTGGNNNSAATVAAVTGILTLVVVATLVMTLDSILGN